MEDDLRPQNTHGYLIIIVSVMVLISCIKAPLGMGSAPDSLKTEASPTISPEPTPLTPTLIIPFPSFTIVPSAKPSSSFTVEPTIETATIISTMTPSTSESTYDNRLLGIWEGEVRAGFYNGRINRSNYWDNTEHFEITNSCNSSKLCLFWKTPNLPAVNPLSQTDETLTTRIGDTPSSFFNQFPELDFIQENPTFFTNQQKANILCFSVIDDTHLKLTVNGPVVWVEVGILSRIGEPNLYTNTQTTSGGKPGLIAFLRNENVWISLENGKEARQITFDAKSEVKTKNGITSFINIGYSNLKWSPNGLFLSFIRKEISKSGDLVVEVKYSLQVCNIKNNNIREVLSEPVSGYTWRPDSIAIAYGKEIHWNDKYSETINAAGIWEINLQTNRSSEIIAPVNDKHLIDPSFSFDSRYLSFEEVVYLEGHGLFGIYDFDTKSYTVYDKTFGNYSWSPGSNIIAFDGSVYVPGEGTMIQLFDANQNSTSPLTPFDSSMIYYLPLFSPDGKKIVYLGSRDIVITNSLWLINLDGTEPKMIAPEVTGGYSFDWSPMSDKIIYSYQIDGKCVIYKFDITTSRTQYIIDGNSPMWQPTTE
jgi:Tol biopolymer transport system component/uncharacterized protein (DUF1499 family)